MHGTCMEARPMHHKLSHPINSGHHVQRANHRLQTNNGGIESPFRSESGRKNERNSRRLKKHQPITYASLCINSVPPFYPGITVQPAHHNQFIHSTGPTNACAQAHTVQINSGHHVQRANHRLKTNNGGIEIPFRSESGRENERNSRRLKITTRSQYSGTENSTS